MIETLPAIVTNRRLRTEGQFASERANKFFLNNIRFLQLTATYVLYYNSQPML